MKFKLPWLRSKPAPLSTRPPRPKSATPAEDSQPPGERSWHGSSVDLHDGLNVVEDADVTVPGDLGPPERKRERGA